MTTDRAALAEAVRNLVASSARPVVLIDGGAGSGKTTLAGALAATWPGGVVQVVGLDEVYPGWHGLASAAAAVPGLVAGTGFTTWDWEHDRPGDWRPLDPGRALIVEGCGALTPASRAVAGLAVWLELDEQTRRDRALARDGELFAAHWDEWAAQEAAHWRADHPRDLADLILTTDAAPNPT